MFVRLTFLLMMSVLIIMLQKKLHEETKGSVYINQYFNDLNMFDAHYKSTGPEIWEQTGKITSFCCL